MDKIKYKGKSRNAPSMGISGLLWDLVFPPRCPVCGRPINPGERIRLYDPSVCCSRDYLSAYICGECEAEFSYIREPYCKKCGRQLAGVGECDYCSDCTEKERSFISCRCLMTYDELAREVLIGIKYHGRKEYCRALGLIAADRLGGWVHTIRPDIIVPVPVHGDRLKKRGYNQAEEIAAVIGRQLGIAVSGNILKRTHATAALKSLSADERLMALRNAFTSDLNAVRPVSGISSTSKPCRQQAVPAKTTSCPDTSGNTYKKVRRKDITVLVIDDIYTTGATMQACTESLMAAGAGRVYGLCIAAGSDTPGSGGKVGSAVRQDPYRRYTSEKP